MIWQTYYISVRLAIAHDTTSQLLGLWKAKEIKKQLLKSLLWSVTLYGSESWTLKEADKRKIIAFELWAW